MRPKHPEPAVETILQTLEQQGLVEPEIIEKFARNAADRAASQCTPRAIRRVAEAFDPPITVGMLP